MSFTIRTLREDKPSRASGTSSVLRLFLRLSSPLHYFLRRFLAQQEEHRKHKERIHLLQRTIVVLVAILCAFLLFAGTVRALVFLRGFGMNTLVRSTAAELPKDAFGHTNILLLGQGDNAHDGIDLTDTIMIASIDEKTKSVAMLSLPRDLYFLSTARMGKGRINSLYRDYKTALHAQGMEERDASQAAMRELANEIGSAIDLNIHHILKVDFIGFVQAVDAIGGIDIEVPEDLVDTQYPGPNYTYETFQIDAGLQHLDGETALKYARSRHSTSDFARSARQQQILQAVGDKVKTENILMKPNQILSLLKILESHVETTLTVREMVGLAKLGKEVDRTKILSLQLNDQNGLYGSFIEQGGFLYSPPRDQFGGAAVLLPVSIPEFPVTWRQVRAFVQLFAHERAMHLEKAPITILNAGAPSGSARILGGELARYGLNIVDARNAEGDDKDISSLSGPQGSASAQRLAELLHMPLVPNGTGLEASVSSAASSAPPSPITITLGVDYGYRPLQDAVLPPPSPEE